MKKKLIAMILCGSTLVSVPVWAGQEQTVVYEGAGYSSAEDAAEAFLDAYVKQDLDEMVSTFAIETYVDGYQLDKVVERLTAYMPAIAYVPNTSEYARELNINLRYSDVCTELRNQYRYFSFNPEEDMSSYVKLKPDSGEEMTGEELIEYVYPNLNWMDAEMEYSFVDPGSLSDLVYNEKNIENLNGQAKQYGADSIQTMAAELTVGDKAYYLCFDTVQYGEKWYMLNLGGNIGALLGASVLQSGLIPADTVD